MPKKPPPNPFSFYMKDVQQQMRERGQRVPSMREMPALASPTWNRMTPEEKAPYEEMARAFKRNRAQTDDGRFTSDGIPIQVLMQQEVEAEESVKAIEAAVRTLINTMTGDLSQMTFFVVGFNILIGTLEELYLPNEIGIVEYCIMDGIKNDYHRFIDPGQIPIGYTSIAKQTSETVHEIPISGFVLATSDYARLYKDVKRFLRLDKDVEIRYVFCHPNEMNQFQRCLNWIKEKSGLNGKEEIVVASLAVLVAELKAAINEAYPYKSSVVDAISSTSFDYSPNTLCKFHDEKDNKNCALGYCRRLAYVLSDILCKPYGVEVTSNHFPERSSVAESILWEPASNLKPVVNNVDVPTKPVLPHVPTTIVKNIRSKFDDEEYSVTPSAFSETSSVTNESVHFDDDSSFPALTDRVSQMSVSSPRQSEAAGPSWAQVSGRKPLRMPKSTPETPMQYRQPGGASDYSQGVGIGRGRGNVPDNSRK